MSSLLKIPVSLYFVFLFSIVSGSDPYRFSAGAGEAGMSYVCIMKRSFWSTFHNQASLAYTKSVYSGVNYENRFGITELGTCTAGIIIPAGKAAIGGVCSHFGYTDFKRAMAGVACGLKLSDKIAAGVQIDYFSEKTSAEYNTSQSVTFETGLLISPTENIWIGFHLFNPVPNSIRKAYLPTIIRTGIGSNISTTLFAGAEVEMSTRGKLIIRTGVEYEASKKFWLRSGFSSDNNSFSFGLGYLAKIVLLDLGFTTHERLGVTTSASLIFKIH